MSSRDDTHRPEDAEHTEELSPQGMEQVGDSVGPYKLRETIGEGGMGIVYVAERQAPFRQKVALKLVKPGMDTRHVLARFSAERQALALMDHPNIAKVMDAGSTDSGRPYFVMELVRGIPITQYCDEQRFTIRQRAELFVEVCHAIQHAHHKGIIHRDIKPGNVLVTEHDGRPVPKVIDFGVAKAMNQSLSEETVYTMHRQVVGTVQYMSPEQSELSGLDIDTRSDVYALGLLFYEMIAGGLPFDQDSFDQASFDEKRRIIREEEPATPSARISTLSEATPEILRSRRAEVDRLRKEIRGELDWIVMKALQKNRAHRYGSPLELAIDVGHYLHDEPVLAGPPTVAYRAGKFVRRHRRSVALASLLFLLGIGATAGLLGQRAQREARVVAATDNVADAIEQASLDLGRAVGAPVGHEDDWIVARTSRQRIVDALEGGPVSDAVETRAQEFLASFEQASARRELAKSIEDILIRQATHMDLESWSQMERELRGLFAHRGIDFDQLTPAQASVKIREHPSSQRLSDALELWIGTRAQMGAMGGPKATEETMQPWAQAIYDADPDPLRTGIRRVFYDRANATPEGVEALIRDVNLSEVAPRTLSWLAMAFLAVGKPERSNEIQALALQSHPDDLMLNFDAAYVLGSQNSWDRAVRYLMRCTALRPEESGVWRALGNALRHNDELEEADSALERSLELAPGYAPTLVDLVEVKLAREDFTAAAGLARQATNFAPDSAAAFAGLGRALMGLGRYEEALSALTQCQTLMKEGPGQMPVEEWLAQCREQL